jgi:hypothetical protein
MALRGKIVNLSWLAFLDEADEIGCIRHIAIMQKKLRVFDVGVDVEMIDAGGIKRGGPPLDAMDDITLAEQDLSKISPVLTCGAGNECNLFRHLILISAFAGNLTNNDGAILLGAAQTIPI